MYQVLKPEETVTDRKSRMVTFPESQILKKAFLWEGYIIIELRTNTLYIRFWYFFMDSYSASEKLW